MFSKQIFPLTNLDLPVANIQIFWHKINYFFNNG